MGRGLAISGVLGLFFFLGGIAMALVTDFDIMVMSNQEVELQVFSGILHHYAWSRQVWGI